MVVVRAGRTDAGGEGVLFTGLIEDIGEVTRIADIPEGKRIRIRGRLAPPRPVRGESVSVNGVCQTITADPDELEFEVIAVGETLRRTTLGRLRVGSRVHLERALKVGDRLGGHWVQGHIDAPARVREVRIAGNDRSVVIEIPETIAPYVVEKGSIAVDGVSLTVGRVEAGAFAVHLIPETWERTLFSATRTGDLVNLEADILAKYVEKAVRAQVGSGEGRTARAVLEDWNREGGYGISG